MGKQKHDLGVRKWAINAAHNGERQPKPERTVRHIPEPENYYGPPQVIREKAHALRQLGQPTEAQAIIDDWHFGRQVDWTPIQHREYDPRRKQDRGRRG